MEAVVLLEPLVGPALPAGFADVVVCFATGFGAVFGACPENPYLFEELVFVSSRSATLFVPFREAELDAEPFDLFPCPLELPVRGREADRDWSDLDCPVWDCGPDLGRAALALRAPTCASGRFAERLGELLLGRLFAPLPAIAGELEAFATLPLLLA